MKILIAEDDFISRRLLQTILSSYGQCDVAVNGREAIEAFRMALDEGNKYDLICLDIMMPEIGGQKVLKNIREMEREYGQEGLDGVKVVMITALGDSENVMRAFRAQCEAYIVKPVEKENLLTTLKELGFTI